jgi:hypothetical protein
MSSKGRNQRDWQKLDQACTLQRRIDQHIGPNAAAFTIRVDANLVSAALD